MGYSITFSQMNIMYNDPNLGDCYKLIEKNTHHVFVFVCLLFNIFYCLVYFQALPLPGPAPSSSLQASGEAVGPASQSSVGSPRRSGKPNTGSGRAHGSGHVRSRHGMLLVPGPSSHHAVAGRLTSCLCVGNIQNLQKLSGGTKLTAVRYSCPTEH